MPLCLQFSLKRILSKEIDYFLPNATFSFYFKSVVTHEGNDYSEEAITFTWQGKKDLIKMAS